MAPPAMNWLPVKGRREGAVPIAELPHVEGPPDMVRMLLMQLAHRAWTTLSQLLQVALLGLEHKPLLAHQLAAAGATGVILDLLRQAPRRHRSWPALSTCCVGLLAALVRCEGGDEAAQPHALRLLLQLLAARSTCARARQGVATLLHWIVAQKTVHRDKLLAVGALPSVLGALRRLDVLCDVVAVQELLWLLVHLTDDDGPSGPPVAGADASSWEQGAQPQHTHAEVAARLAPLLYLYGMPCQAQHGHMAALVTRALHVQVAGHDGGKQALRRCGSLVVLVDLVRRHTAPYSQAAAAAARTAARAPNGQLPLHPSFSMRRRSRSSSGAAPGARYGAQVSDRRPPAHTECGTHTNGFCIDTDSDDDEGAAPGHAWPGTTHGSARPGPYGNGSDPAALAAAAAGVTLTPWLRLMAVVLVVHGVAPGLAAREGAGGAGAGAGPGGRGAGEEDAGHSAGGQPSTSGAAAGQSPAALAADAAAAVADGACYACYGLLLPLLVDGGGDQPPPGGEPAQRGSGGGAAEGDGGGGGPLWASGSLRRRLCPLREALATLKSLMADCEPNTVVAGEAGLAPLLVELVAYGDMGLAWQAAEAAVALCEGPYGAELVACGAVEELAYLLQESAETLHGLTLRKQIQLQASRMHAEHAAPAAQHAQHGHPHPPAILPSAPGTGPSTASITAAAIAAAVATAASAAPTTVSAVHVRPSPHAARPQRLFLIGRVRLDFTTSTSCFYGSHDATTYCDYCTPSAAIKALLRLMAAAPAAAPGRPPLAPPPPGGAHRGPGAGGVGAKGAGAPRGSAAPEVCRRFAAAGGLHGLLLLLHHEAAGVHHSKLAASLLTLLDLVLEHDRAAQDELRNVGGVGVLSSLLGSLMRGGVMDVYQLRPALCRTLALALRDNAANNLAAREHGLLPLLVSLLTTLVEQRKKSSDELVLDDGGPLSFAVLAALLAAAQGSRGTQDALVALGALHPVCGLVRDERADPELRAAAVRVCTAVCGECPTGHSGALALGVVPVVVGWLERLAPGGTDGAAGWAEGCALAAAELLAALLVGGGGGGVHAGAKAAVMQGGALPVLLRMLRQHGSGGSGGGGSVAAAVAAAGVLTLLAEADVDIQNELAAQGALAAAAGLVQRGGAAAAPAALGLVSAMLRRNTFVKNTARQSGLPATLVDLVRRCGLEDVATAAAAAGALTELVSGNHSNQEVVAVEGGLEVAVGLAREAFAALPVGQADGDGAGGVAAAWGDSRRASGDGSGGHGGSSNRPLGRLSRGSVDGGHGPLGGTASVREGALAAAARTATHGPAAAARLLRALLQLVCACVELHGGNKEYVRELGGVTLVGELLRAASTALTSTPPPPPPASAPPHPSHHATGAAQQQPDAQAAWQQHAQQLWAVRQQRAALAPAAAAACCAVSELCADSLANQSRLEEQPGVAQALFELLVATDAPTSAAAARAIEWLVLRNGTLSLDTPTRDAFEGDLVDLLAITLYVPCSFPAASAGAVQGPRRRSGANGDGGYGLVPWHARVTALMPSGGLDAVAVKEAAALLAAIADAGDALEQQAAGGKGGAAGVGGKAAAGGAAAQAAGSSGLGSRNSAPAATNTERSATPTDTASGLLLSPALRPMGHVGLLGPMGHLASGGGGPEGAGGPGSSQTEWAALAGRAAPGFQRIANGPLLGAQDGGGAGGGADAHAERKRQLAWMVYLLAAKAPENRARLRRLVRTSLTPLAQQLANAEACRAQLEAATAAAAAALPPASSVALESSSSLVGRLPVSTPAFEDPNAQHQPPPMSQYNMYGASVVPPPGGAAAPPPFPPQPPAGPAAPTASYDGLPAPPSGAGGAAAGIGAGAQAYAGQAGSNPPPTSALRPPAASDLPTPFSLPGGAAATVAAVTAAAAAAAAGAAAPAAAPAPPPASAAHPAPVALPEVAGSISLGLDPRAVGLAGTPPHPSSSNPPSSSLSFGALASAPTPTGLAPAGAAAAAVAGLTQLDPPSSSSSFSSLTQHGSVDVSAAGATGQGAPYRTPGASRLGPSSRQPSTSLSGVPGGAGAGAGGGGGGSGAGTPRLSLTGATLAAYAPPSGASAAGPGGSVHTSRAASPTRSTSGLGLARPAGMDSAGSAPLHGSASASAMSGSGAGLGGAAAGQGGPGSGPPSASSHPHVPRIGGHSFYPRPGSAGPGGGGAGVQPQRGRGSSGGGSDDDELAMIQQEVALLANSTMGLGSSSSGSGGAPRGALPAHLQQQQGGASRNSPAQSPLRWAGR